jgi:Ner family transcriptional regulator
MHPEDIKAELRKRKLTAVKLSEMAGISPSAIKEAFRRPQPKAEAAIATALKVNPYKLWPDRYLRNGQRRKRSVQRHQINRFEKRSHRLNGEGE